MGKKDKKRRAQQSPSLKERLEIHWNGGRWGAFVSLFVRNREASLRTPLAERWHDALYNCLTASLFAEKDLESAEMALSLIRGDADTDAALRDVGAVAQDFLDARRNGMLPALRPLISESALSACWAELRGGLAAFVPAEKPARGKKADAKDPEALVDKLAKQAGSVGSAKTLSPFTTWLKTAQALEDATKGAPCADAFRAVRSIVGLIRELNVGGSKWDDSRDSLRDPRDIPRHPLFSEIPPEQTHPAVLGLWELFCRTGGLKFGGEWEQAARLLRLAFSETGHPLKQNFDRLMRADKRSWRQLMADMPEGFLETEQEEYVLRALFVSAFLSELLDTGPEEVPHFLASLDRLTKIGRRRRPQSPWPNVVRQAFEEFIAMCPPFIAPLLERTDLPYESLSAVSLVLLVCLRSGDTQGVRSNADSRLPLRLTPEEVDRIAVSLGGHLPPRRAMRGMKSILDGESWARLLSQWIYYIAESTQDDATDGVPYARQLWASLTPDHLDELCSLPPDDPRGCFCRLCADVRPGSLSRDPARVEAFFEALPPDDPFGAAAGAFLLTWPDVDPRFILRLIERSFPAHQEAANEETWAMKEHWFCLAELVGGVPDREGRMLIANGILDLMRRFGVRNQTPGFSKACSMLEKFAERTPTGKSTRKAKRTSPGQTMLPL